MFNKIVKRSFFSAFVLNCFAENGTGLFMRGADCRPLWDGEQETEMDQKRNSEEYNDSDKDNLLARIFMLDDPDVHVRYTPYQTILE